MDGAAIDALIDTIVASLAGGEPVEPVSLTFLLRCYATTERADLVPALEVGLAQALDRQAEAQTTVERAAWLVLLSDALALSADDRLSVAVVSLVETLQHDWVRQAAVVENAAAVDACLRASRAVDLRSTVVDAIDELERVVAAAYRPGAGLSIANGAGAATTGGIAAHVALSSALLTAYVVSGRLPYSMLADELMQFAQRTLWRETAPRLTAAEPDATRAVIAQCDAARVLCGLAALHADEDYRKAAVIRPDAAYVEDAARILAAVRVTASESTAGRGAYGLALQEFLRVR